MNFYKEQEVSQKKTKALLPFFTISVMIVTFSAGMFFITIYMYLFDEQYHPLTLSPFYILTHTGINIIIISFLTIFAIIMYGFLKKMEELSKGGETIAKELYAIRLFSDKATAKERVLINIVEEISIAAGIPVLPIYIIENRHINAFVAGTTYDNAVFGVTKGAVELLNRDELQGVIAHEFSHIFSGDMRLNSYISGFINGIMYIFIIGMELIMPVRLISTSHEKPKTLYDILFIILYPLSIIVGIFLALIGFTGAACASCIQLFINYQREYLADAYAVQFTRYPGGIANALKKIGHYGYRLTSANIGYFNHIFFASWSSPSISHRIYKVEPMWNGKYINTKKQSDKIFKKAQQKETLRVVDTMSIAYMLNQLANSGNITKEQIERAHRILENIPVSLKQSAANPLESEFIIYSLLFDKEFEARQIQMEFAADKIFPDDKKVQKTAVDKMSDIYADMILLNRSLYLNIIHICVSTLKTISPEQYKTLKFIINTFMEYDDHISLFEWCIKYLVLYPLDINFALKKPFIGRHTHIGAVKDDIEILLSSLAYTQSKNDKDAKELFHKARNKAKLTSLQYISHSDFSQKAFEKAIDEMQDSKPLVRRKIMETAIYVLTLDNEISTDDLIIMHTISEALHLPLGVS
ncbi:MAG: M48 family metalloprotease [Campylobacteraceae bacterium]|jgi:Zn-dependent protease with chaperone function|nr:M48 family metalloprotease [Campylobacteraceae bacterium]